jgi:hypothetical protein
VLVSVLAILAALMIIFFAALTYCLSLYGVHVKEKNRMVAGFLADAGIQHQLAAMQRGSLVKPRWSEPSPNGGFFSAYSREWGPYVLIVSEGKLANQTVAASALVGSVPPGIFKAAITACNRSYPFVVAGNTTIHGDVNTGPLGMTTGRIRGEGVVSEHFHRGATNAIPNLRRPRLDSSVIDRYLQELPSRRQRAEIVLPGTQVWRTTPPEELANYTSVVIENNLLIQDVQMNVEREVVTLFADGAVEIAGSSRIGGLYEICADGPIYLKDSSIVDKALLFSKDSIIISDDAAFSGVAVSLTRIVVREKGRLLWPGSLTVAASAEPPVDSCGIWLTSRGMLEGGCYLHQDVADSSFRRYRVYLDTGSTFNGVIVSEGAADLRGTVHGTVVTDHFTYEEPTTVYVNWVKDLQVDRTAFNYLPVPPILREEVPERRLQILRQDRQP